MRQAWILSSLVIAILVSSAASAHPQVRSQVHHYFNQPVDYRIASKGNPAFGDMDLGRIAIDFISKARNRIVFTGFELGLPEVVDALIRAHQEQGVKDVTVLLDSEYLADFEQKNSEDALDKEQRPIDLDTGREKEGTALKLTPPEIERRNRARSMAQKLRDAGIKVVTTELFKAQRKGFPGILHAKVIVRDPGTSNAATIISSGNWTQSDFYGDVDESGKYLGRGNQNSLTVIENRDVTDWIDSYLKLMAEGRFGQTLPQGARREFTVDGEPFEVLIAPSVPIPEILAERIQAVGNRKIQIAAFWLSNRAVAGAIAENLEKYPELSVEVICDWGSAADSRSRFADLKKLSRKVGAGRLLLLEFRDSNPDPYEGLRDKLHHKFAILEGIVDGRTVSEVMDGSANFTWGAGHINTEISFIQKSARAVNEYRQRFTFLREQVLRANRQKHPNPIHQGYGKENLALVAKLQADPSLDPAMAEELGRIRKDVLTPLGFRQMTNALKERQESGIQKGRASKSIDPIQDQAGTSRSGRISTLRVGYFSDLHGAVFPRRSLGSDERVGGLGQFLKVFRDTPFDLRVFGGDMDDGGALETALDQGRFVPRLLSENAKLDVRALGNHEYSQGFEQFRYRTKLFHKAGVPCVCANVQGVPGVVPMIVKEIKGLKVLITGALTRNRIGAETLKAYSEALAKSDPYLPGAKDAFAIQDPYASIEAMVRDHGPRVDAVIVLAHMGSDISETDNVVELAKRVPGITAIVTGHGDKARATPLYLNGTPILEAGSMGRYVGDLLLTFEDRSRSKAQLLAYEGDLIPITENLPVESNVRDAIDKFEKSLPNRAEWLETIARLPVAAIADRERADEVVGKISGINLTSTIATAVREEFALDVVLVNGGGIRNSLPAGDITRKELREMRPTAHQYPDFPYYEITGHELSQIFEKAFAEDPLTRFSLGPDLSYDLSLQGRSGSRRARLLLNGKTLPENKMFRVAMTGYLAAEVVKDTELASGKRKLLDGDRAVENYFRRTFPLPPLKHETPKAPSFSRSTASSTDKSGVSSLPSPAYFWNYSPKSVEEVQSGYFQLDDEISRYESRSKSYVEKVRDYYSARKVTAESLKPEELERRINEQRKRGRDPEKVVDGLNLEKFDRISADLDQELQSRLNRIKAIRSKIWETGHMLNRFPCPNLSLCIEELNQLRRFVDESFREMDLERWAAQRQRMIVAGDQLSTTYEVRKTFSREVETYFRTVLDLIPDRSVRDASRMLLERLPAYFYLSPSASSGDFHDPMQKKIGGLAEHSARAATDLVHRQRLPEYRRTLLAEIQSRPHLRSLAERIGEVDLIDLLRSYEIMGILLHDGLKHGWVEDQLGVPSSRNLQGKHSRFTGLFAGYPNENPLPVGYGTPHESLAPEFMRILLAGDLKGKLDPYLSEWVIQEMVHHAGPWSPGEPGALFAEEEGKALGNIHRSDKRETVAMAVKTNVGGKDEPILKSKTYTSVLVEPRVDSKTGKTYWENTHTHDRYDEAYIRERYIAGDLTEVKEKSAKPGKVFRMIAVNSNVSRTPKPLLISVGDGKYVDQTNPYAKAANEKELPYSRPVYLNEEWDSKHREYVPTSAYLLPAPGQASPASNTTYRVKRADGSSVSFASEEDARRFAAENKISSKRIERVPGIEKKTPTEAQDPQADPYRNEYQVEAEKREFVDREFGEALRGIQREDLRQAARLALEWAPHIFEFIPAVPTGKYERAPGLRDFGGMVIHTRNTLVAFEDLVTEGKVTAGKWSDLVRVALLIRHSADHGWVNRQFDLPQGSARSFEQTFGVNGLGWAHPKFYLVTGPEGEKTFTRYDEAVAERERIEKKHGEGSSQIRPGMDFVLPKMFRRLSDEGKIPLAEYRVMMEGLRLAHDAETRFRTPQRDIPASDQDPASVIAQAILQSEALAVDRTTVKKQLATESGGQRSFPYFEGFSRNIPFDAIESEDGVARYKNRLTGDIHTQSQLEAMAKPLHADGIYGSLVKMKKGSDGKAPTFWRQGTPTVFEPVLVQGEVRWRNTKWNEDPLYLSPDESWRPLRGGIFPKGFVVKALGSEAFAFTRDDAAALAKMSGDAEARVEEVSRLDSTEKARAISPTKKAFEKQSEFQALALELQRKVLDRDFEVKMSELRAEREKARPKLVASARPSTRPTLLRSTALSAGTFAIQAMGSDLLVMGVTGDWERFRTWGSFDELKKVLKGWAGLSVSGAVGDTLFKLGYGNWVKKSWAPGTAAFGGRVIPLWFALTGAELLEHGSVSPSSMAIAVPNVMAAHGVAEGLIRAVRIPMRGLKAAMTTPISAPEMMAMGILEFSLIHGLSKAETWAMDEWNRREMVEAIAENVAHFQKVSLSDRVGAGYANKRLEWQGAYQKVTLSLGMYGDRDRLKAESVKAYELSELAKDRQLSPNERKAREYEIDRRYREEIRRWSNQEREVGALGELKVPVPTGRDRGAYERELEDTLSRSLQEPAHAFQLTQQIIQQTLQAMTMRWEEARKTGTDG